MFVSCPLRRLAVPPRGLESVAGFFKVVGQDCGLLVQLVCE